MTTAFKDHINLLVNRIDNVGDIVSIGRVGPKTIVCDLRLGVERTKRETNKELEFIARVTGESFRLTTPKELVNQIVQLYFPAVIRKLKVRIRDTIVTLTDDEDLYKRPLSYEDDIGEHLTKVLAFRKSEDFKKHPNYHKVAALVEKNPDLFFMFYMRHEVEFNEEVPFNEQEGIIDLNLLESLEGYKFPGSFSTDFFTCYLEDEEEVYTFNELFPEAFE